MTQEQSGLLPALTIWPAQNYQSPARIGEPQRQSSRAHSKKEAAPYFPLSRDAAQSAGGHGGQPRSWVYPTVAPLRMTAATTEELPSHTAKLRPLL